jgi:hypothetical protein
MTYKILPFSGSSDLGAMHALAQAYPNQHLHVIDLPWRLCSWGMDEHENIGLWLDSCGQLASWVVLQTPCMRTQVTKRSTMCWSIARIMNNEPTQGQGMGRIES